MELTVNQPFDLVSSLESGQAHRWAYPKDGDDGWYTGVVRGNLVRIRQIDDRVEFRCAPSEEAAFAPRLAEYFRFDDDISKIYDMINQDERVAAMVRRYPGLRVFEDRALGVPGGVHLLRYVQHSTHPSEYGEHFRGFRFSGQPERLDPPHFPHPG